MFILCCHLSVFLATTRGVGLSVGGQIGWRGGVYFGGKTEQKSFICFWEEVVGVNGAAAWGPS